MCLPKATGGALISIYLYVIVLGSTGNLVFLRICNACYAQYIGLG